MSDNLRDRIAAVLMRDAFGLTTQTAALRQADAVIRELGLDREDGECRFCHAQLPCGRWVAWDE